MLTLFASYLYTNKRFDAVEKWFCESLQSTGLIENRITKWIERKYVNLCRDLYIVFLIAPREIYTNLHISVIGINVSKIINRNVKINSVGFLFPIVLVKGSVVNCNKEDDSAMNILNACVTGLRKNE